jgi:hypothetical protein
MEGDSESDQIRRSARKRKKNSLFEDYIDDVIFDENFFTEEDKEDSNITSMLCVLIPFFSE